jgi:rhamnose utilization protein RhaD (predicted bifunctional aldolase and dehydrogenase)
LNQNIYNLNLFCSEISENRNFVQGAGGNVSFKTNKSLWIKKSGSLLESALIDNIFCKLEIKKNIPNSFPPFYLVNNGEDKPSIELLLHACLPQRYILHLHIPNVLSLDLESNFTFVKSLTNNFDISIIPYTKPGINLAKLVYEDFIKNGRKDIYILRNHGVLITGDEIKDLRVKLLDLDCFTRRDSPYKKVNSRLKNIKLNNTEYVLLYKDAISSLVFNDRLFENLEKIWPICPDQIVFLGKKPIKFQNLEEAKSFKKKLTKIFFIKECGVFIDRNNFSKVDYAQLLFFVDTLKNIHDPSKINILNDSEVDEILNFDEEKIRVENNKSNYLDKSQ